MFIFLRSRLRFAGRIGWIDGRRGYPGDEHFVEMTLYRPPTPHLPVASADVEDNVSAELVPLTKARAIGDVT